MPTYTGYADKKQINKELNDLKIKISKINAYRYASSMSFENSSLTVQINQEILDLKKASKNINRMDELLQRLAVTQATIVYATTKNGNSAKGCRYEYIDSFVNKLSKENKKTFDHNFENLKSALLNARKNISYKKSNKVKNYGNNNQIEDIPIEIWVKIKHEKIDKSVTQKSFAARAALVTIGVVALAFHPVLIFPAIVLTIFCSLCATKSLVRDTSKEKRKTHSENDVLESFRNKNSQSFEIQQVSSKKTSEHEIEMQPFSPSTRPKP